MNKVNKRLLAMAAVLLAAGILLALAFDNLALRYAVGIGTFAVGLGMLRRAFRVE
jgi:lysylphosphatidylglycerol synthetase-like protein (DUF2156 family)